MPADSPITRVRRAKGRSTSGGDGPDFGAVALGMLVPLVAIFPMLAGPMPLELRIGMVTGAIVVGGCVAGLVAGGGPNRAFVHGAAVAAGTIGVLGLVTGSMILADGAVERIPLMTLYRHGPVAIVAGVGVGILVAGLAGAIGRHFRTRFTP